MKWLSILVLRGNEMWCWHHLILSRLYTAKVILYFSINNQGRVYTAAASLQQRFADQKKWDLGSKDWTLAGSIFPWLNHKTTQLMIFLSVLSSKWPLVMFWWLSMPNEEDDYWHTCGHVMPRGVWPPVITGVTCGSLGVLLIIIVLFTNSHG